VVGLSLAVLFAVFVNLQAFVTAVFSDPDSLNPKPDSDPGFNGSNKK
jgi:hypothetical protein